MTRLSTSVWNLEKLSTRPPVEGLEPDLRRWSYERWNPGHTPLVNDSVCPLEPFHVERLARERGLVVPQGGSGTSPWGFYEKARFEGPEQGQRAPVVTVRGTVRLSREELMQLAVYPSELFHTAQGGWVCPLDIVPASPESIVNAISQVPEGQPLARELGLQWLKYCAGREDSYEIRGDGIGASYQWGDLVALLEPQRSNVDTDEMQPALNLIREGSFVVATQEGLIGRFSGDDATVLEVQRPFIEQEIKARRWPCDTVEVQLADGVSVSVSKRDLQRMAVLEPYDVALVGSIWVCRRPDQQVLTEESLEERLKQLPDGEVHDWQLIRDCAKVFEPEWLFNLMSTAPNPEVRKVTRHGVPFVVFSHPPGFHSGYHR